jgi:hypothetical protein
VVQLVSLLLAAGVDDNNSFCKVMFAAWALFWVATLTLARFRANPSQAELVAIRYGPLVMLFLVFAVGQYV